LLTPTSTGASSSTGASIFRTVASQCSMYQKEGWMPAALQAAPPMLAMHSGHGGRGTRAWLQFMCSNERHPILSLPPARSLSGSAPFRVAPYFLLLDRVTCLVKQGHVCTE
jgi:hypothetical protein